MKIEPQIAIRLLFDMLCVADTFTIRLVIDLSLRNNDETTRLRGDEKQERLRYTPRLSILIMKFGLL